MSDQAGAGDSGRKRRSFIEVAELYQPIVPLPGAAAQVRPDATPDDLPPTAGPQAIPAPPRSPASIVPSAPAAAKPRAGPAPRPVAAPERRLRVPSAPPVLPAQAEIPSSAVPAAGPRRPRRPRLWPWAALLLLVLAAAAALWVGRAQLVSVTHLPALPLLAPETVTPPPADAPAPRTAGPPDVTAEPAPAVPTLPAPQEAPAPAAPASPSVDTPTPALAEAAPQPTSAAPSAAPEAPAPEAQPAAPASATPEPPAAAPPPGPEPTSAEPAAPAPAPEPNAAPTPIPAPAASPAEAGPQAQAPAAAPARKNWRVVIYFHSGAAAAEAEASRLVAQLGPLTAQASTSRANAVPQRLSVLYFHPEDAAAAQELATALGRPAAESRVRAMPPPRTRRPPGTFEVWLPDPS